MPVEKNQEYIVEIVDNGFEGEGIAKIEGFTVFIPNTIKGEKVKILIVKVLSSHAYGKVLEVILKSSNRMEADCDTYARCGGCNLRHVKYQETLKMKQNAVQSLVNKTLKQKIEVQETLGMENPYHYRNKAQYPVGYDKNGRPQIGVFASRTHEIIPMKQCKIQHPEAERLAKFVFDFWVSHQLTVYNEKTQKGLLRHIVIKVGFHTKQLMCVLVLNGKRFLQEKEFIQEVTTEFPEVKTIVLNQNQKNTNVILGKENRVIYGNGLIQDQLGDFQFFISPLSFYQVNPIQAEKLYQLGVEGAKISENDIAFDLYCGIGTISLFMARQAKKVYGIEIVEEAIEMAKENAHLNQVNNVEFMAGDVEKLLQVLIEQRKILPDVVMVDPPRKGLDERSIQNLLKIQSKRITYISCNPATLVRDLAKFEEKYTIESITPVDMFPFTSHCEVVSVLQLK